MALNGFRAASFLGDELYRGAEEVMEQPPLIAVEVIEKINA